MDKSEMTNEDRQKELRFLLSQMKEHPERDWSEARMRVKVLSEVLAPHESAHG
jgi:hypothetical protein